MPTFGELALGSITPLRIQSWINDLVERGLSPSTVQGCYRLLSRIMNAAVNARLIAISPCRGITLPRVERAEMMFLNPDELQRLAVAAGAFSPLIYSAGYLGLRWGELAGLRRARVDPLRGTLEVVEALSDVSGPPPLRTAQDQGGATARFDPAISMLDARRPPLAATRGPGVARVRGARWRTAAAHRVPQSPLEARRDGRRPAARPTLPRSASHLRVASHRAGSASQRDPGSAGTLIDHHDTRSLRASLPEPRRTPPGWARCHLPTGSGFRGSVRMHLSTITCSSHARSARGLFVVFRGTPRRSDPAMGNRKGPVTRAFIAWGVLDSNQRPLACRASALPG